VTLPDGTITQPHNASKMPPGAHVFETEHAGQQFSLAGDIPKPDLDEFRAGLKKRALTREQIAATVGLLKKSRDATERAIMFWGIGAEIGIANFGGLAMFPMLCLTEPEYVEQLHEIAITHAMEQIEKLLPLAADCVDVFMVCPDDWGTQNAPIAAPQVYRDLFMPYYKRVNGLIHQIAPQTKTFFHSCGAIYDMLDDIAESGFDVLNPVQWPAGGHSYQEWKDRARGKLAFWGGGVNAQATLPLGTVEDVEREVHEVVSCLAQDSGYVFCAIHNILAEIAPEKVVAMYRTAGAVRL
jgi:uroporphyrinogen decarboxylase